MLAIAESHPWNYAHKQLLFSQVDTPAHPLESAPVAANATLKEFGAVIRQHRLERGLSQQQLADVLREFCDIAVSASAVGEWERGLSEPTKDKVFGLEVVFHLKSGTLSWLLGYGPPTESVIRFEVVGDDEGLLIDLNLLRELDPEAYESIANLTERAVKNARGRRPRSSQDQVARRGSGADQVHRRAGSAASDQRAAAKDADADEQTVEPRRSPRGDAPEEQEV